MSVSTRNNFYDKNLKPFARENRHKMTKAEACLWKYVLKAKKTGYTFNRQRPALHYIADFMCKELKLIIEVDGYTHQIDKVAANDIVRQRNLELAGFTVIRFDDAEILTQIDRVHFEILNTIQVLSSK